MSLLGAPPLVADRASGAHAPDEQVTAELTTSGTRALWGERDYGFFWFCRFASIFAHQMQSITIGWQVYVLARLTLSVEQSAFMVGLAGLATFAPIFLLTLPGGEAADRHNRKTILSFTLVGQVLTTLALAVASWQGWTSVALLIGVSVVLGALRAYYTPSIGSLGPMLVPRALLPRAIAWNSLALQFGRIGGPAVGGLLVAISPLHAYAAACALFLGALLLVILIRKSTQPIVNAGSRWGLMRQGISYVWRNKVVFGAISLDLVAVLVGGATALLPVFARDILHVGVEGFGLLRSAPAIGAAIAGIALAVNPVHRRAGAWMFWGVAIFGVATVVFSLSQVLWISVAALATLGAADMVSVYVRQSLIQLSTPDAMRGRVSAVSSVFVGASNELGEFETGVVARFLGPVSAALAGGIGALIATGIWAAIFPALRKADRLDQTHHGDATIGSRTVNLTLPIA